MLKPLFESHSIDAITILCEYTADVEKTGLDFIRGEAKLIQRKLPFRRVKRKGAASLPSHDISAGQPEVLGFGFLQKVMDEETENFEISGERTSFTSQRYSSFESFFADSVFFLSKAHHAYELSGAKLKRVILRYEDTFTSDIAEWEPYESLREGSPYIPSAIIKKGDFWHTEAGFFSQTDDGLLLNNYKIQHNIQTELDADGIIYLLKLHLTHLFESAHLQKISDFPSELKVAIERLRIEHRKILRGILSDELAKTIGLDVTVVKQEA